MKACAKKKDGLNLLCFRRTSCTILLLLKNPSSSWYQSCTQSTNPRRIKHSFYSLAIKPGTFDMLINMPGTSLKPPWSMRDWIFLNDWVKLSLLLCHFRAINWLRTACKACARVLQQVIDYPSMVLLSFHCCFHHFRMTV